MSIKKFIIRIYITLISSTVLLATLLTSIESKYLLSNAFNRNKNLIQNVIRLHRNDLLNEIAAEDYNSLKEHLEIMREELGAERISLNLNNKTSFSVTARPADSKVNEAVMATFTTIFQIPNVVTNVSSDFANYSFSMEVLSREKILKTELFPIIRTFFLISILMIFLLSGAFLLTFIQFQKHLLFPLSAITKYFKNSRPSNLDAINNPFALNEIQAISDAVREYDRLKEAFVIGEVAAQVAHDIKSPLAALDTIVSHTFELPEETRLIIRSAVNRIHSIANTLLAKKRVNLSNVKIQLPAEAESFSMCSISVVIDSILAEKRLQYKSRSRVEIIGDFDSSAYGSVVRIQIVEFKRMLSNLINNAVEALEDGGKVVITVSKKHNALEIIVQDNGIGIPLNILKEIRENSRTFGKPNGNGLGLRHAKNTIKRCYGSLDISSIENKGTQIAISLPTANTSKFNEVKI